MSVSILIPCNALDRGKSRLGGMLTAEHRRDLCVALLRRTLSLARMLERTERILLVTPDAEAMAIASEYKVSALNDGGANLNAALAAGRAKVIERSGQHAAILVLPIDLAEATAAAVAGVIRRDLDVAIAPDAQQLGTNLLYVANGALCAFPFSFGPNSFLLHRSWAQRHGFRVEAINEPLLAFDLDRPQDFARWQCRPGAG